jgi:predicted metal-dependent phosphoesterase TrpH
MKRLAVATAVLAAAFVIAVGVAIPPARLTLANPSPDGSVAGILHVHTNRSDGQSSPEAIAAAAARAGLRFVVFTDHGDATRAPDPPEYRSGVLCLDGVEISTAGGHYIALDMPAAPYPLAGEPRDVIEDVRRLGGFGIAAHPDSPKPQLRWDDWLAPFDGIETINPDTSWRQWAQQAATAMPAPKGRGSPEWAARRRLGLAILAYPFRSSETIASLIQPGGTLYRWAHLTARRRVVGIAGVDAHAKLQLRGDPADSRFSLPLPGYEAIFRTLSVRVTPDRPLSGNAKADAAVVTRAIRAGHLYSAVDGIATPPSFELTATNSLGAVHQGDEIGVGGPITLHVRSNAPPSFTTIVWNGGKVVSADHHDQDFTMSLPPDPAAYWIEIRATGRASETTWVSSNPIYVRGPEDPEPEATRPPPDVSQPIFDGISDAGWRVEHDENSRAAVEAATIGGGALLRFRYALAGGPAAGQFVCLAYDTPNGAAPNDRVAFTVRADHPMRISVQVRVPGSGRDGAERWQRSVYVDAVDRERTVSFDDLTPIGPTRSRPVLADVRSILFVIDTTNAKPSSSGRFWIRQASLQR